MPTRAHVEYVSDSPYRLLSVGAGVPLDELRGLAKRMRRRLQVGLPPDPPPAISRDLGVDNLSSLDEVIGQLESNARESLRYRLFWPHVWTPAAPIQHGVGDLDSCAHGNLDTAICTHARFVAAWLRFCLGHDPVRLASALAAFKEVYTNSQFDEYLLRFPRAEHPGPEDVLDVLYDVQKWMHEHLADRSCSIAMELWRTGRHAAASEIVHVVCDSALHKDAKSRALRQHVRPEGDAATERLKRVIRFAPAWDDAYTVYDGSEVTPLMRLAQSAASEVPSSSDWGRAAQERIDQVALALGDQARSMAAEQGDQAAAVSLLRHGLALEPSDRAATQLQADEEAVLEGDYGLVPSRRYWGVTFLATAEEYAYPPICACCLEQTDNTTRIEARWEETRGAETFRHWRHVHIPVCPECLRHSRDFRVCGIGLVMGSVAAAVSFATGVLCLGGRPNPWLLSAVTALGSLLAFRMLGRVVRVRDLPSRHASRGPAVWIASASSLYTVLGFRSRTYARRFAEANRTMAEPHSGGWWYDRRSSLIAGQSGAALGTVTVALASLAGAIAANIAATAPGPVGPASAASANHFAGRAGRAPSPPPVPGPYSLPATDSAASVRRKRLRAEHDALQSQLRVAAPEVDADEEALGAEAAAMRQSAASIDLERSVLDRTDGDAVDLFNAHVREHNSRLREHRAAARRHDARIDAYNAKVRRLGDVDKALAEMGE